MLLYCPASLESPTMHAMGYRVPICTHPSVPIGTGLRHPPHIDATAGENLAPDYGGQSSSTRWHGRGPAVTSRRRPPRRVSSSSFTWWSGSGGPATPARGGGADLDTLREDDRARRWRARRRHEVHDHGRALVATIQSDRGPGRSGTRFRELPRSRCRCERSGRGGPGPALPPAGLRRSPGHPR